MNETLRRAIFSAGLSEDDVAARLGVDPKTVRRWLDGRLPYPRLRWHLAALLEADETDLWPELLAARSASAMSADVMAIYPRRSSVPRDFWYRFFDSACQEIGILACSGLFIAEADGLIDLLRLKTASGVRLRIALRHPDGQQIDSMTAEDVPDALDLFGPLFQESPNAELRTHQTHLPNAIYHSDNQLLINQYAHGIAAGSSPVLHLRGDRSAEMTAVYLASFERIWASAASYPNDP